MPQRTSDVLILDEDLLWRRILDQPAWWTKNPDGTIRPSSSSFLQRKDGDSLENGLSVQLAKLTTKEKASSIIESAGLAEIQVKCLRDLQLLIIHDPIENKENSSEDDIAHTLICPQNGQKITKTQARKMAESARMILLPKSQRTK
jgi:hypothetical protein